MGEQDQVRLDKDRVERSDRHAKKTADESGSMIDENVNFEECAGESAVITYH